MLPAGRTLRACRFAPVHLAPLGSTVALSDQISREFKVSDQGIDMEIEFNDDAHEATGAKLYLQLKSGDSCTGQRRSDGAEIFTLKKQRHAEYWRAQASRSAPNFPRAGGFDLALRALGGNFGDCKSLLLGSPISAVSPRKETHSSSAGRGRSR